MFKDQLKFKLYALSLTFFLLFILNNSVTGQNSLSGVVLEKGNHNPLADATVYINGTTKGVSTGADGSFILNDVSFPCQLMISRVGYELKMITMDKPYPEKCILFLKEKTNRLSEVKVMGKNTRSESVKEFINAYLGIDEWGRKAKLLNDSVLVFNRTVDTIDINTDTTYSVLLSPENINHKNKTCANNLQIIKTFSVKAKAPLIIDLPAIGYKLYNDLVNFEVIENQSHAVCRYLGYYYYKPYVNVNERMERRLKKNRMDAYYNSREHFCRMLYNNELRQNGYLLYGKIRNDSTKSWEDKFINFSDFPSSKDNEKIQIFGQKGKTYTLYSFYNYNNKPIDLTDRKKFDFSSVPEFWRENYSYISAKSMVTFLTDTCTIRSDGTLPDNNILLFGGKIPFKKVAATLPWNYRPGD